MKLTSLSKSVRTIGVMAILSVTIATTLQQPIQAQSKVPSTSDGTCVPLPQGTVYREFGGIKFSSDQKLAYRNSIAKVQKRFKVLNATIKEVDNPERSVNLYFNKGIGAKKTSEINAMLDALMRDKVPGDKIVELINKKHGKYAKAVISQYTAPFTPQQIAEGHQIGLNFEAEMLSVFTPEQQKIYRANLSIQRRIQACMEPTPYAKIMSPDPF